MRTVAILLTVGMLAAIAGCGRSDKADYALRDEIALLNDQNKELAKQLEEVKAEKTELTERVEVLSNLPDDVKGENIYVLEKVDLTKHTNFYDKDEDGTREKLIVYLQPVDKDGDIIKATGDVNVQLWDLNKEDGQAKLGEWKVGHEQLSTLWFNTLMRTNFRLTFDTLDIVKEVKEPLTVKVVFTDYLSGKTFKQQHVIEP